jgi:hypothetical protein
MKTKLTFLLSIIFLFLFSYEGECNPKSNNLDNNHFENFDIEGLGRDDSRSSIEYKRSFCGGYSLRIIVADSNKVMNKILKEIPNLVE